MLFKAVCLMALWHYPRRISLGACNCTPDSELPALRGQQWSYLHIHVAYVRNELVAIGQATMVAIGTTSLAFPVLFIAVGLMALLPYPRQMSRGL